MLADNLIAFVFESRDPFVDARRAISTVCLLAAKLDVRGVE